MKRTITMMMLCFVAMAMQAQTKVCMSYDDFKASKWKS